MTLEAARANNLDVGEYFRDVTEVEVRTDGITLVITELPGGGLLVVADPRVAGLELTTTTESQGITRRTRITARDAA